MDGRSRSGLLGSESSEIQIRGFSSHLIMSSLTSRLDLFALLSYLPDCLDLMYQSMCSCARSRIMSLSL
jgi:hypothetical protein